jgi:hypothetical protein
MIGSVSFVDNDGKIIHTFEGDNLELSEAIWEYSFRYSKEYRDKLIIKWGDE